MPQLPLEALRIEEQIESKIEQRLLVKADRSLYRSLVLACTDALKRLRDEIADLEEELKIVLSRSGPRLLPV